MISITSYILPLEKWTLSAKKHAEEVTPFTDAFLKRRALGKKHPVHDFLFTYYNCSPLKLTQWIPSYEEGLIITPEIHKDYPWMNKEWFNLDGDILSLKIERIHENNRGIAHFIMQLCRNILDRSPRFGCYGLHEWAMVYKLSPEALRHNDFPLRLRQDELTRFVDTQKLCCTHYDAYRFFTKEASPLNTLKPCLETRLQMEQGGCIHTNMDIYKWSTKLWPWIGSDFLAKAFFLALEGRELDMRASPYDLREVGYEPLCIETEEGRKQYQQEQQLYASHATILREELLAFCTRLIKIFN